MKVFKVPKNLKIYREVDYPPHNKSFNLEGEVSKRLIKKRKQIKTDLTFLPIQWTNYFMRYSKNPEEIKKFYDKKIKNNKKSFFTVIQYADGNLIETSGITYFAASGLNNKLTGPDTTCIEIPLLADKHVVSKNKNSEKKYLGSFIGRNTHPIRKKLSESLKNNPSFYFDLFDEPSISKERQKKFLDLMDSSYFALCPRGYGVTSYRLYEAFEFGVVPVYVSREDQYYLPFKDVIDWEKLCVFHDPEKEDNLENKLEKLISTEKYKEMVHYGKYCNENYFNFEFLTDYIIQKIEKL
tara:strand:+ start:1540 stop:2427 length:888 start_codon:yes stop_codon:yes gene_type:complete